MTPLRFEPSSIFRNSRPTYCARTEVGSSVASEWKPSFFAIFFMDKLSGNISASIRNSFSSLAICMTRRNSSVPRP